MKKAVHSMRCFAARRSPIASLRVLLAGLSGFLPACPHPGHLATPQAGGRDRVQTFTDSSPVLGVTATDKSVFVATSSGFDVFADGKHVLHLDENAGLPGGAVRAVASANDDTSMWMATESGLAYYAPRTGSLHTVAPPPPDMVRALSEVNAMAVDPAGGAWLGGDGGVFHVTPAGSWTRAPIEEPCTALFADAAGMVWAAVPGAVIAVELGGQVRRFDFGEGFVVPTTRFTTSLSDGHPVFVGEDGSGRTLLSFWEDGIFTTLRADPGVRVWGAARAATELVLGVSTGTGATETRELVAISKGPVAGTARRGGISLAYVAGRQRELPGRLWPLAVRVPSDVNVLSASPGRAALYLGTRQHGTLGIVDRAQKKAVWLRTRDITDHAVDFTVACLQPDECLIATGARRSWRYNGEQVSPLLPLAESGRPAVVLAVAPSAQGEVFAVYHDGDARSLRLARFKNDELEPIPGLEITAPRETDSISFARFDRSGLLWIGLHVRDKENDPIPWGVALANPQFGTVFYYRQERRKSRKEERAARLAGMMPIPNNVTDVAFMEDGVVWLATTAGAARIQGDHVQVFSELNGLDSEILHGVVATSGGAVFVASAGGVSSFDGKRWETPHGLSHRANEIAQDSAGLLWIATDKGVGSFDGLHLSVLGEHEGLLPGPVQHIAIDRFDRVWAYTAEGISLIARPGKNP